MKSRNCRLFVAAFFAAFLLVSNLQAQPLVNIETVTVGDAGNAADTNNFTPKTYGAVTNVFRIGKYEVTIGQYTTFLNSVARTNTNSYIVNLWNAGMATDLNIAGISRSGAGTLASPYSYSVIGSGNRPITYVSWFDAARFANWMNNGATNGASTETGAYTLNGATSGIVTVNPGATWFLPTEDQWYKAAYYKGGTTNAGYWLYPTKSDTVPGNTIAGNGAQANYNNGIYCVTRDYFRDSTQNYLTDAGAFPESASAYNTYDQGGNVWEWNDAVGLSGSDRGIRGGAWNSETYPVGFSLMSSDRMPYNETYEEPSLGFRIASVAQPLYEVTLTLQSSTNMTTWTNVLTNVVETTNTKEFYRNLIDVKIK